MERFRLRTISLLILVFLVATPTIAAPPPQSVCEPCGEGFSEAATWYGQDTNLVNETATGVEHSTVTVRVYENETAIWTVRNQLMSERAVRYFRNNHDAFTEITESAEGYSDIHFFSAKIVGSDTAVLRYRSDEQVVRTRGDTLRFDGFREIGTRRISDLGADEMTVIGPSGTHITRAPSDATVRGNELELTEYDGGRGNGPFVTFTQSGGVAGEFWSFVSVSETLADNVIRNLLLNVLLPAVSLLAFLVGFVWLSEKTVKRDERTAKCLAGIVMALGVLTLFFGLLGIADGGSFASGIVIAGSAYTVLALLTFADVRPTLPRVAGGVLLAWGAGIAILFASAIAVDSYVVSGLLALDYYAVNNFMFAAFSSLFLLSMAVVGYAVSDPRYRRVAIALPPTMLAVSLAMARPITYVGTSLYTLYSLLFVGVILVAVTFVGIPAFLLGRMIPAEKS
ncbi:hypothetical protein [Haladaptatus cibarius]|uniref:hypothetical protein n=1 Tax=Haladaptatus cibarius TaxID=453847 RepID=UPI0006794E90|nr:hypothetical protein [Haladaptatus cibarius]